MKSIAGTPKLDDNKAEQARQATVQAVSELQKMPSASLTSLGDVSLPNGTTVPIPHGLGRAPSFVHLSAIKTAGVTAGTIVDVTAILGFNAAKYVALQANGFGATIKVTVAVM